MIFQSIDLYFFTLKPTQLPLVFLGLLAIYVIFQMSRYIFGELKTALRETKKDRFMIYTSGLIFTVFASVAIVFMIALVISSLAINTIYGLQETKLIYIDAMAKPWQYALFIPVGFVLLISFIFIYQIMDSMRMASPMNEGVMRIQRAIERKLIKRLRAPWSYVIALTFLLVLMGVVPYLLYYFVKTEDVLAQFNYSLSDFWLIALVFIPYLMLFPIFYLSYYSTVGNAQLLFLGSKLISSRKTWGKSKLRMWIIYFFIAFVSLISEFNSFIEMIPYLLTGELPQVTTSYKDVGRGLVAQVIELIIKSIPGNTAQNLERFYLFTAIIPLDFVLFAVTTVGFALYGFRNEFIRKENLNTPRMVIFAAFILCGVSFSIFLNVITTWPWVIPDDILPFELSDPIQQRMVLYFFFPAVVIEQVFTIGFLIFNLFFNKELQNSASHNILEKAVMEKNLDVIERYVQRSNSELRLYISGTLGDILSDIEEEPDKLHKFIKILEQILKDPEMQTAESGIPIFEKLILNFPESEWETLLTTLFTDKKMSQVILDGIGVRIMQFHTENLPELKRIVDILINKELSPQGETVFIGIIRSVAERTESYTINITLPLLTTSNSTLCRGGLAIIKELIREFQPVYPELFKTVEGLIKSPDADLQLKALGVLGAISAMDALYLGHFNAILQKLNPDVGYKIKKQVIGSIAQIIVTNPSLFGQLIPRISAYFEENDPVIHADLAISVGIIIAAISKQDYSQKIFPLLTKLAMEPNEDVKRALLQSLLLVIKVRNEFTKDLQFMKLLLPYFEHYHEDLPENMLLSLYQVDAEALVIFLEILATANVKENFPVDLKVYQIIFSYIDQIHEEIYSRLERSPVISLWIQIVSKNPDLHLPLSQLLVHMSDKSYLIFLQSYPFFEKIIAENEDPLVAPIITLYGSLALTLIPSSEKKTPKLPSPLPPFLNNPDQQKNLHDLQVQIVKSLEIPIFIPRLLTLINKESPLTVAKILTFISLLENIDVEIQKAIFNKIIPLFSKKNDAILPIIRYMFTYTNVDPKTTQKIQPKVLSTILAYLERTKQPPLQEVTKTLNFLIRDPQQWPELSRYFVKFIRKAKNSEVQAICLITLSKIPDVILNSDFMQILFSNIYHKQTSVRLTSLRTVGLILCESLHTNKDDNGVQVAPETGKSVIQISSLMSKYLTRFADYALLVDPEDEVRIEFISQISQIAQLYPHFQPFLVILNQAIHDKKQNLSITAVQSLFKALGANPQNIDVILNSLQHVFKNTGVIVRLEGIQQCLRLLKKPLSPAIQKSLYQMIISFASDEESKIRSKVIPQIQKLISGLNADFLKNLEFLLLSFRSQNPFMNRDHFKIVQSLLEMFEAINLSNSSQSILFRVIVHMNQYSDIPLKRNMAKNIDKITKIFPKKIPQIIGMIYLLLQSRDNTVIATLKDPILAIVQKSPKSQAEIVRNLKKMLTKSVHREITKLLETLTMKNKKPV